MCDGSLVYSSHCCALLQCAAAVAACSLRCQSQCRTLVESWFEWLFHPKMIRRSLCDTLWTSLNGFWTFNYQTFVGSCCLLTYFLPLIDRLPSASLFMAEEDQMVQWFFSFVNRSWSKSLFLSCHSSYQQVLNQIRPVESHRGYFWTNKLTDLPLLCVYSLDVFFNDTVCIYFGYILTKKINK